MRYYSFIIKGNNETIGKNAKIRLKDYDYDSNICAMNKYMYKSVENCQTFFVFREEGDRLFADFSFDENKDSFSTAYNTITDLLAEYFLIKKVIEEPSEITMRQYLEGCEECRRRNYYNAVYQLTETANIWFYNDNYKKGPHNKGNIEYSEMIIRDREMTDAGMYHPSFLKELKMISQHTPGKELSGSMIHYVLSAKSIGAAVDLAETLSQELYAAGRIQSRRVGIISDIEPYFYKYNNHIMDIMENNRGGVLLVDLSETFGNSPSDYPMAADYIADIFKKYRNKCLFIFMYNMDKPGFSYYILPKINKYALTVSLREGAGNRESAVKYLEMLISGSEYSKYSYQAKEFLEQYKSDHFSQTEVLECFESFGPWCLNKNAFKSYIQISSDAFYLDRDENTESAYEKLNKMIGLEEVKRQIEKIIAADIVEKRRKQFKGREYKSSSMHMVFSGNPGTAKTTVARLFAGIAKEKGILKSGVFVEKCGTDFNSIAYPYIIKEAFTAARGGVLFIDEAYAIALPGAATLLVQEMENRRDEVIVIFAGYTDRMKEFLELNEGLKSRIPYHVNFPDYNPAEMTEIFKLMLDEQDFFATEAAIKEAYYLFDRKKSIKDLGNGRYARNLVENSIRNQALRLMPAGRDVENLTEKDLFVLEAEDILDSDDQSVQAKKEEKTMSALAELDSLIGLERVKNVVHKAIKKYRYNKLCMDKGIKRNNLTMHMVFTGNPGTAKTTVARLIGQILAEEGILPTGGFIEAGKADLVDPAIGATPIIVNEKFRKAKGGVLFIDEAYSIFGDSLSDDAIDTIVKEMENNREDTVVIFAGYPDQMEDFLNRNPGMNSRIAFKINFDDYSVDELMEITRFMLSKEQMTISDPAFEKLRLIYEKAVKIPDYGNGRFVRKILEQAEMNLSDRVMDLGNEEITPEMLGRIEECDITDITPGIKTSERHIGFTAD